MFAREGDVFLFIVLQDILDEMRKELSKLKEELIDGNSYSQSAERGATRKHYTSRCSRLSGLACLQFQRSIIFERD